MVENMTKPTTPKTGADRLEGVRYDQVPHIAIKRMAARFEYGIARWGDVPIQDKTFTPDDKRKAINHLLKHALDFKETGDRYKDNLGAILANAAIRAVIAEQEQQTEFDRATFLESRDYPMHVGVDEPHTEVEIAVPAAMFGKKIKVKFRKL